MPRQLDPRRKATAARGLRGAHRGAGRGAGVRCVFTNAAPIGPCFSARFEVAKLPFGFGQDASWATDGEILSSQNDAAGITQIYRARLNGRHQVCLTCRTVKGPNGLAQERPEGDWILFDSFG